MLAMYDFRPPPLFNGRSAALVIVFSIMAFFVSPFSPLNPRTQDRVTAFYLPAILTWWYLFQVRLMSLNPGVHYYLSHHGVFTWMMNSAICYAFGLAFSIRLWRLSREWPRVVGVVFAVLFSLLALFGGCRPAVQQTAIDSEMEEARHSFQKTFPDEMESGADFQAQRTVYPGPTTDHRSG